MKAAVKTPTNAKAQLTPSPLRNRRTRSATKFSRPLYHGRTNIRKAAQRTADTRLTADLFEGGALDSQVTDSQFVRNLTGSLGEYEVESPIKNLAEKNGLCARSPSPLKAECITVPNHPIRQAKRSASSEPGIASNPLQLQLTDMEELVVLKLREAKADEIETLLQSLYDLRSEYRGLRAWNGELVAQLVQHDIPLPMFPAHQFCGFPSPSLP